MTAIYRVDADSESPAQAAASAQLIRILQNAYSGEVAAAYAYRGHWHSLKDSPEKERIKEIEAEEWDHRRRVGEWLARLGAAPRPIREWAFWTIARSELPFLGLVHTDVLCRQARKPKFGRI